MAKQDWRRASRWKRLGWLTPIYFDFMSDYDRARGGALRKWVLDTLGERGMLPEWDLERVARDASRAFSEDPGEGPVRRLFPRHWEEFLRAVARIERDRRP